MNNSNICNPIDNKIYQLKKIISTLEWDINQIKNNRLKALKEEKLRQLRKELQDLLEKCSG